MRTDVGVDPAGGPQGGGQTGGLTIPGGLGGPSRLTRRNRLTNGLPSGVERQPPCVQYLPKFPHESGQEEAGGAVPDTSASPRAIGHAGGSPQAGGRIRGTWGPWSAGVPAS
jgi:hypothetical protein